MPDESENVAVSHDILHGDTTEDVLLAGSLRLRQPRRGHRAGTDAMLLIAAAGEADHVVDLGSGVGTVGLGLLALGRVRRADLVECDGVFAELARQNIALNDMASVARVIEADITAPARILAQAGLVPGEADLVVANPPFNEPGHHRASPDARRLKAHAMDQGAFEGWAKAAARALKPQGRFVLIHRPEALVWLLPMLATRFRDLAIRPVHAVSDEPAKRVLIAGRLGSKAPARLLPALVLHQSGGAHSAEAMSIYAGTCMIGL